PGRAAIEAVANPAETDYFFFVADGTGGHAFARTLAEHRVNVANWRKIEKERKAQQEN
ncbi:MAG: endolytic transglycosylase MltG, partial [Pseudomonadota bacterium]